jgi:hypothetical protein
MGKRKTTDKLDLVGKYFHSVDPEGRLDHQGKVEALMCPGLYFVRLYSWQDGRPTIGYFVGPESMGRWAFFDTDEDWRRAGDSALRRQQETSFWEFPDINEAEARRAGAGEQKPESAKADAGKLQKRPNSTLRLKSATVGARDKPGFSRKPARRDT